MQLTTSNDTETSEAAYLNVITAKTAALFAAACQLGAVVAERSAAEEEALKSLGLNLGIAYQLVDDALDYDAPRVGPGQVGRRRLPRRQDHPARGSGVSPGRRRGARLLAPDHGGRSSRRTATSRER